MTETATALARRALADVHFVSRAECAAAIGKLRDLPRWRGNPHFDSHLPRLSHALAIVPRASAKGAALLDIGSKLEMLPILGPLHGYGHIVGTSYEPAGESFAAAGTVEGLDAVYHFDAEHTLLPCVPESFDTVTCFEVIEHMKTDPMALMGQINRVLKPGGWLAISTLNAASLMSIRKILGGYSPSLYGHFVLNQGANRHNKEYTYKSSTAWCAQPASRS